MNLYSAPLEAITTYIYRNAHNKMFGGVDAYYAPFILPSDTVRVSRKSMRDILPERNDTVNLKVQVMAKTAEAFFKFEEKIKEMGYDEININLGCPAATVVRKGRGSGFLRFPEALDAFLDEIFSKTTVKVSVKTRTGYYSGEEMGALMDIYNKYPLSSLIIHPRAREDFYNGVPDDAVFCDAYKTSKNRVCYNGNVFCRRDYERVTNEFPKIEGVMIGRGMLANPAIFREIRGGAALERDELIEFSHLLAKGYFEAYESDTFALQKMKEMWMYAMWNYPEEKKILKAIKKSTKLSDLFDAIEKLGEIENRCYQMNDK